MISAFSTPINKFTSTKLWYYIENFLVVFFLFYCIKFLTDYDNVYYQTWKNAAASKAIFAFTAIVFIIRKVKLLNWQSLVATLLFGAVVFERMRFWADAEDILNAVKPQLASEWLSLMIIIDMILYKNVNNLFKDVNIIFILYVVMTIGMIWRRHDRIDPIVLIFPMLLFALVKMDEEKTEWFMRRFIDAWFLAFVYVIVKSFTDYPYDGQRYYGCFVNIGHFGIFMACCFVLSIIALMYSKHKWGAFSFQFLICLFWLISDVIMIWIIDTRTALIGVLFCLSFMFIYYRKDTTKKIIRKRYLLLGSLYIFIILIIAITMLLCSNISYEWIRENNNGPLSPLIHIIVKFKAMIVIKKDLPWSQRLFKMIDIFTSGRLSIISEYSKYFNYDGNGPIGFELEKFDNYWVYAAHNTYVQFLVEYGYLSFVEMLAVLFLTIKATMNRYLSFKRLCDSLPLLWLITMVGVWFGESSTFFYPITFFSFMFIAILIPNNYAPKTKDS